MSEEEMLNRMSIDAKLAELRAEDRDMINLIFAYDQPSDYHGNWPPTLAEIGDFIGRKYKGRPLSEASIRNRRNAVLQRWQEAQQQ